MSDKGKFMAATLVDWKYPDAFNNTWKKLGKLYKKKLRSKNYIKNQLNTFVVTEAELDKLPSKGDRIETEEKIKELLKKYSDAINKLHHTEHSKQGDIGKIYKEGFESQNRIPLFHTYEEKKAEKFEKIEDEIEKTALNGSVIIWDMPGYEGDRVILPECVATFEAIPEESEQLTDVVDEVLIANFARRYLPFSHELIVDAVDNFNHLEKLCEKLNEEDHVPEGL
ncbi:MAG: hypothetical protein ACXAD7_15840, partial [Candidatus Kariarchaeaceae archaeon]